MQPISYEDFLQKTGETRRSFPPFLFAGLNKESLASYPLQHYAACGGQDALLAACHQVYSEMLEELLEYLVRTNVGRWDEDLKTAIDTAVTNAIELRQNKVPLTRQAALIAITRLREAKLEAGGGIVISLEDFAEIVGEYQEDIDWEDSNFCIRYYSDIFKNRFSIKKYFERHGLDAFKTAYFADFDMLEAAIANVVRTEGKELFFFIFDKAEAFYFDEVTAKAA